MAGSLDEKIRVRRWMTAQRSFARDAVLLVLILAPALWLLQVQGKDADQEFPWTGHPAGFHLPSWLQGDSPFYRAAIESLLRDRDLDLRNNADWAVLSPESQLALGQRGEWYPKHPLALPVAALGFYALAGDHGLLAFNLLQLLALDVLILLAARRFASANIALITALLFSLASLLCRAALNFSPDVFSTLLVFAAYLCLIERRAAPAGLLFGIAVAAKWTNVIFLPIALVWSLVVLKPRATLILAAFATPPLLALAALNAHMFGAPWITPYDRVAVGLLAGAPHLAPSHRELFDQPFWSGLWTQLVDPSSGLMVSAPPLVFLPAGLVALWRRSGAETLLTACMACAQMALFGPYRDWGATSIGHRFLMTVVVLGAAPAAALLESWQSQQPGSRKAALGRSG